MPSITDRQALDPNDQNAAEADLHSRHGKGYYRPYPVVHASSISVRWTTGVRLEPVVSLTLDGRQRVSPFSYMHIETEG